MQALFDAVNAICGKIQVVSDLFWEFPTNFGWYAAIPILGNFSLAIILLVGTGIFLTVRFRFVQVRKFKYGLKVLLHSKAATKTGISALAAFLLSTAMRVGPGNILGVTGAISIGGCGCRLFSGCPQPLRNPRCPRFLKKKEMGSMSEDFLFMEEDC